MKIVDYYSFKQTNTPALHFWFRVGCHVAGYREANEGTNEGNARPLLGHSGRAAAALIATKRAFVWLELDNGHKVSKAVLCCTLHCQMSLSLSADLMFTRSGSNVEWPAER